MKVKRRSLDSARLLSTVRSASISITGSGSQVNQDRCFVATASDVFIVADGMGGEMGGEVASALAIELLTARLNHATPVGTVVGAVPVIEEAVLAAHVAIRARAAEDVQLRGMGTTVVVAVCNGRRLYLAHVGDSRAYWIRAGRMEPLTSDHSLVAELVRSGRITQSAARTHPLRHHVTQFLGCDAPLQIELRHVDLESGDCLLLCTDGVTSALSDDAIAGTIAARLTDLNEACIAVVSLAMKQGSKDDATVVLAQWS